MTFTDTDTRLNQAGNTIGNELIDVTLEMEEALIGDNALQQEPTSTSSSGEESAAIPDAPTDATVSRPHSQQPESNNFRQEDAEMETEQTMIPSAHVRPHQATTFSSRDQLETVIRDAHALTASIYSAGDRGATQLLPRKTMQSLRSIMHHTIEQIRLLTPEINGPLVPAIQHRPANHAATYPRNKPSMCRQCNAPWPCKDASCPSWMQAVKTKKDRMGRRAAAKVKAAETATPPIPANCTLAPTRSELFAVDDAGRAYKPRKPTSHGIDSHLSRLSLKHSKIHKRNSYIRQQRRSESGQSSSDEPREQDTLRTSENSGYVSQDEPRIIGEIRRNPNSGNAPLNKSGSSKKMENFFTQQAPNQSQPRR